MPTGRSRARLALLLVLLPLTGCASMRPRVLSPNPLDVPSGDFEQVWTTTVHVLDEYFDTVNENRLANKIVTEPVSGATLFEPWAGDSVGFGERLESTLQSTRRFAIAYVEPTPEGGHSVRVEVHKELEDLAKPDRQYGGKATYPFDFPINRSREVVGPIPVPLGWIPKGRDDLLEQVILGRIRDKLTEPPRERW
jgi:hypothetical protein